MKTVGDKLRARRKGKPLKEVLQTKRKTKPRKERSK